MNKPEFMETETWNYPIPTLKIGTFSQVSPLKWEVCRERFSCDMTNLGFKSFYVVTIDKKAEDVASFIFKTEEILNLSERTTYSKMSCSKILKVNMTDFWLESHVKRSLFTLLIRLGSYYNVVNDNYEDVLFNPSVSPSSQYKSTLKAVRRFMYGATSYAGVIPDVSPAQTMDTSGWCSTFTGHNSWRLLDKVKVKDNDNLPSPISFGKLWG